MLKIVRKVMLKEPGTKMPISGVFTVNLFALFKRAIRMTVAP